METIPRQRRDNRNKHAIIRKSTSHISRLEGTNHNARKPVSPKTELHDAIWRGDRGRFSEYLKDADLVAPDELGQQPLHLTTERGDKELVSKLLEKTEKDKTETILGAQCAIGQTALHRAAWGGSVVVVELLNDKINADIKDKDGNTALHIAAEMGFEPVVELLINKSNCKAKNCNNVTPLHYAAGSGQQRDIELLLKKGADLKAEDRYGWLPLHYAAESGQRRVVELLLNTGADVNAKDGKVGWCLIRNTSWRAIM